MQELEKILEEIDQEKKNAALSIRHTTGYKAGQIRMAERIEEIIRKHMNDDWIPVEERLPEAEQEHVLACRRDGSIDTARYSPYSDRWYVGSMCSVSLDIIAGRPLPEPYRPERSEVE